MNSNSMLGRALWHPVVRATVQGAVFGMLILVGAVAVFLMLTGLGVVVSG